MELASSSSVFAPSSSSSSNDIPALKSNSKYNDFRKKGLDHYGLLRQLLPTVAQTSSTQHVSAVSFARAPESRKTVESTQVPDYSMAKVTKILISMCDDLDDKTMFKATEKLVTAEWREAFITSLRIDDWAGSSI
ncbi:uncharacterized protein LOC126703253 [Quercus robur]|uniref:uncharacterized protein LOC126703253 n=1 Tax=Quercus robur TaxID=38942 RepID=UPI0021616369|nr:uncharacterized protein LOC126703253 [Quercus robur]XP_050258166.1 uncharacterized protein LOC126703253 [Quercus robur]XP_050258167.1 uncharacterized protein LOC126703253 [Quercus robur]